MSEWIVWTLRGMLIGAFFGGVWSSDMVLRKVTCREVVE